ncbi:glycine cleavage system protein R [Microbacterium terricola]|uniref:glycine cleavage system protein R n=1 Tax=Microbacterium terricola TaxID=344163 RepID=UPI0021E8F037|nr:ACT domain-containing protein [Microbacterium terricola]UYK39720.1 ACT domain-containing protein [Microbacterium terricola]
MSTLILTVIGDDRAGLVAAVAEIVDAHGGNWERSQLAELAGTFAGVIEVAVPDARSDELRAALADLDGLLTVAVRAAAAGAVEPRRQVTLSVLGNDHPGIVREISAALRSHDVSIDHMETRTRDAAMSGGRLFEATVVARVPASVDLGGLQTTLEQLASEIQVEVTLGE